MTLAFLENIGAMEYLVIGVVLLLLFGRRLPEVGRSLGKGLVEFKKGLRDVGDEVTRDHDNRSYQQPMYQQPPRPPLAAGTEPTQTAATTAPASAESAPPSSSEA